MEKKEPYNAVFWCSIYFSVISGRMIMGTGFFRWTLMDILTPFLGFILMSVIWGLVIIILITSIVLSLIYLVTSVRRQKFIATIPLIICLFVVLGAYFIPFTKLSVSYDFRTNFSKRVEIVEQIQTGQLKITPTYGENMSAVVLPPDKTSLSRGGGEVLYQNNGSTTSVFFFTFKGIMDNFSGFIYRSDESNPFQTDFGGDYVELIKLRDHWFWAASG